MNYTEMLFNRDERLVNLLNQADNKNLELIEKIERLKQGYCPIKEKCNKGECDCTNEEYNQMCEENTKLDLEIDRLNNIINKLDRESYLGMIENQNNNDFAKGLFIAYKYINDKIEELKGVNK